MLFRSEDVKLSRLILPTDSAYMCISELGELNIVQIRDTTPHISAYQRKFVDEVRRCDEMERKLRYIEKELAGDDFHVAELINVPEAPPPREMIDLESSFEQVESELKEIELSLEQLKKSYTGLSEFRVVIRKSQLFFEEAPYDVTITDQDDEELLVGESRTTDRMAPQFGESDSLIERDELEIAFRDGLEPGQRARRHVEFITGVILRDRLLAFERMLWRVCRGNVFLRHADVEAPLDGTLASECTDKCVFIVFFQGEQLKSRVKKICDGFFATIYPCPNTQDERQSMLLNITGRREDLQLVIKQTQEHRYRVLDAASHSLRGWLVKVHKMKAIYHTLNLFDLDLTTKCMFGECWSAVSDLDNIRLALHRGMERSNSNVQPILDGLSTNEHPPTFHRINKFTATYQAIVDAYGVADYREVNPALFSVITFPFLFAVMFGDAGHGLIMFLFALWMILWEKKIKTKNEVYTTFFDGRYIIVLMGLFSIYTGMIYNDIFSKSTNIFGSSWYPRYDNNSLGPGTHQQLDPRVYTTSSDGGMFVGHPYAFGIDPIWQLSENSILFTNSLKMKMSIILGVLHMLFGVILGAFNHNFFGKRYLIYCELLPQILFLLSIFGYLVIAIFYKWLMYTSLKASTVPSLLTTLINMMTFSYGTKKDEPVEPLFAGQPYVQSLLVVTAIICVPWMLLSKPLLLRHWNSIRQRSQPIRYFAPGSMTIINFGEASSFDDYNRTNPYPMNGDRILSPSSGILNNTVGEVFQLQPIKRSTADHSHEVAADDLEKGDSSLNQADQEPGSEFNFQDVMIGQAIHTIEYCLGCISNTASYLRLWALSLAHSQLSDVLWKMVLQFGLKSNGYYGCIVIFFLFGFWAAFTIAILILMEGLSAFLHALRLHWVEFQNKFYSGTGYPFVPFSFHSNLDS